MFTRIRRTGEQPLWIGEGVWAKLSSAWDSPDYTDEYTRLRESQAAAGEGFSGDSADISDYHTWS
ncbi:hypothetical protein IEQ34_012338 [Dendrobium chrysotoxum]|uniref:Uncharacterized protein n=1 Tax=Dendrobium chrysotoxum TaxID=161865 RepID=A0AAV7GCN5_DENCH|nr:hypothetical protein IEQ34_012338 [Dendrobium chrysotoxum]